jgi:nitroimidazol reductase NimA-like FMN-containing flavoprotein (pyridoxamine 5'-phosphate oxidase superfamily)
MPKPLTEQEQQQFLADRHVAVISAGREDGKAPLSTPIWYGYQPGGDVTLFTGAGASKLKVIQRADVISLTVQREEPPYKFVTIAARLAKIDSPATSDQIFAIASRYLPEDDARWLASADASTRGYELALLTFRPERWQSADYSGDTA